MVLTGENWITGQWWNGTDRGKLKENGEQWWNSTDRGKLNNWAVVEWYWQGKTEERHVGSGEMVLTREKWITVGSGGMVLTGKNWGTVGSACLSVPLCVKIRRWTGLALDRHRNCMMRDLLSHCLKGGTAQILECGQEYQFLLIKYKQLRFSANM